jgi:hypothetical protein
VQLRSPKIAASRRTLLWSLYYGIMTAVHVGHFREFQVATVGAMTSSNESVASWRRTAGVFAFLVLQLLALALMFWSETGPIAAAVFVLTWGVLNFLWLMILCRPAAAALLSLALLALLVTVSLFKHATLLMTVTFTDLMVIDRDTSAFLLTMWPHLQEKVIAALVVGVPLLALVFWLDPLRMRRSMAALGFLGCFAGLAALSFAVPLNREDEFYDHSFVSKFSRSAALAILDLLSRGVLESDAVAADRLARDGEAECKSQTKLPHIVFLFDESSFDITMLPGMRVWPGYSRHFRSFDGRERRLIVEGAGGPSWYTEYNVLTGLSVRSYGRFAEGVTRLASGRVMRGLAHALRRCSYRTFSVYPYSGAFLGARGFQTTAGIEFFQDATNLGSRQREPDSFYFDYAARLLTWERGEGPLFLYIYTSANHFPWNFRFRPDLLPEWRPTGNRVDVDEFLRRQAMSMRDYSQFIARLRREFPDEAFLIVRFGDHQPLFARYFVDPSLNQAGIAERIRNSDPRYLTTYYAIEAINFSPVSVSSALDMLDAPYLPLVVLEAAGVPLDASFAEQKRILQRCSGMFYLCKNGAEASRFNRLLIDAGLIKGL